MEPSENKRLTIVGGTFKTDKNLEITMPPKSSIEKDITAKEDVIEIKASDCIVEKDEKGEVVRRKSVDGKILTETKEKNNSGMDR